MGCTLTLCMGLHQQTPGFQHPPLISTDRHALPSIISFECSRVSRQVNWFHMYS